MIGTVPRGVVRNLGSPARLLPDTQDGDDGVTLDGDEVAGNDRTTERPNDRTTEGVVWRRERLAMKGRVWAVWLCVAR
jgi:hypothetical protein